MKETDLPYPGIINNGDRLRVEVVKAISSLEVSVAPDGSHSEAPKLAAFLQEAADFVTDNLVGTDEEE